MYKALPSQSCVRLLCKRVAIRMSCAVKRCTQRSVVVVLLFMIGLTSGLANEILGIKAAGVADKTFALYFEASYSAPIDESAKNLRVEASKVIFVQAAANGEKPSRTELTCKDNQLILRGFQESPYGRGTEGSALGFECTPQGEFIFLLKKYDVSDDPEECKRNHLLNTKVVALAASFGHQAFCLEDWSSVNDPGTRLEAEFEKSRPQK